MEELSRVQPDVAAAPTRAALRVIFDLLAGVEDRWIRQMVPLAIGLLYRRAGLDEFVPPADLESEDIDSARHYAALSLGAAANSSSDIARIVELAVSEADEHLRAGYVEAAALGSTMAPSASLLDAIGRAQTADPSPAVRQASYRAAGYLARTMGAERGKPWTAILEQGVWDTTLGTDSPDLRTEVRRGAIEGLGVAYQGSDDTAALEALTPYVQDWSNYYLVAEAAFSIGMVALGTRNEHAMSLLRRSLQHPEPHVRWNTGLAMGLVYFRSGDLSLFDDCELALSDEDSAVRYYSSLGVSLAFHGHAPGLVPYYRLKPERLDEYSRIELSLPNVDGLLIAPTQGRDSYSGIGAHLQGYSSWYSLPFYCTTFERGSTKLASPALRPQLEVDYVDLLTLTVAHRFEYLRERGGITVYRLITEAYESLQEILGPRFLAEGHARFWGALDAFTRVHVRSHVAELTSRTEDFVASLEGLPVIESMTSAAGVFAQLAAAVASGRDGQELTEIFGRARTAVGSLAYLGYRAALTDVLQIWESATLTPQR